MKICRILLLIAVVLLVIGITAQVFLPKKKMLGPGQAFLVQISTNSMSMLLNQYLDQGTQEKRNVTLADFSRGRIVVNDAPEETFGSETLGLCSLGRMCSLVSPVDGTKPRYREANTRELLCFVLQHPVPLNTNIVASGSNLKLEKQGGSYVDSTLYMPTIRIDPDGNRSFGFLTCNGATNLFLVAKLP